MFMSQNQMKIGPDGRFSDGQFTFAPLSCNLLLPGVLTGVCGTNTIRFRPCLLFTGNHADIVLDRLDNVLRDVKTG